MQLATWHSARARSAVQLFPVTGQPCATASRPPVCKQLPLTHEYLPAKHSVVSRRQVLPHNGRLMPETLTNWKSCRALRLGASSGVCACTEIGGGLKERSGEFIHTALTDILSEVLSCRAVLYGCETWSLTLREKRRLRVFGNRVLRGILFLRGKR